MSHHGNDIYWENRLESIKDVNKTSPLIEGRSEIEWLIKEVERLEAENAELRKQIVLLSGIHKHGVIK